LERSAVCPQARLAPRLAAGDEIGSYKNEKKPIPSSHRFARKRSEAGAKILQQTAARAWVCPGSLQWAHGLFYAAGGDKPEAFFCFTQDRRHRPNKTRIAFWAENRAEVDRLARLARRLGAKNFEEPELCRGYSAGYYACFFDDPDGNKLEICYREKPIVTG